MKVGTVFLIFLKLGLTSFGGPIAHIGYFRKEFVEKKKWLSESQFSELFAICQFLPGPASSQLGFSIGLLNAGWLGAIAAFVAFTLPSALLLIAFSSVLPHLSSDIGQAIIHGLKLVAFIIVADAVYNMFNKLCTDLITRCIAIASLICLLVLHASWAQITIILLGAVLGILFCSKKTMHQSSNIAAHYGKTFSFICLLTFGLLLVFSLLPIENNATHIGQTFYQVGALVFGGGHVVLPLLEDAMVNGNMLSQQDFLAGYGATQAIPGPMFSFSAYLGALTPGHTQINWLNAGIALFAIFLPGFLLISAALPLWQRVSNNQLATKAIAGVNAAVVGLLAAALYDPIFTASIHDTDDLLMGAVGLSILMIWRLSPMWIIVYCVLGSVFIASIPLT